MSGINKLQNHPDYFPPFSPGKAGSLVVLTFLMFIGGWNMMGQNPAYIHDAPNSLNLDNFSITAADAFNPQAKINRLIIAVDVNPAGDRFVLTFGNGIKRVGITDGLIDFIPNQNNRLSNSLDFAINSEGKFFVATNESNRRFIRVYSSTGVYLPNETLGDGDYGVSGANKFKGPTGLAFDKDDNLYVADHYIGDANPSKPSSIKIYRKDSSGNYKNNLITEFDNIQGTLLNFPYRLAVNSQGHLYMSELGQDGTPQVKILEFDAGFNPKLIDVISGAASKIGSPGSIIIDKFDNIFIADLGELDLPRILSATNNVDEFYAVFEIIKNGIQNNLFHINVYNQNNSFNNTITSQIDFPIDIAMSKCGTLYVNNAIFDGTIKKICSFCPRVPNITIDFDLEAYTRSPGYDIEKPSIVDCPPDQTETLTNGKFKLLDYRSLAQFIDNCDEDLRLTQTPFPGIDISKTTEITIIATDDSGNFSEPCLFKILIVEETNTAPVAIDDTYNTNQDVHLSIDAPGVLGNDSDTENDLLTSILQSQPGNGTVTLNPDGSFIYSPNSGYFGTDTFTYLANDGTLNSNVANVTVNVIEVTKPNTVPIATDDTYTTNQDVDLTIDAPGVLGNDSDAENDVLTAILQSQPGNGTVTLNPDGSFVYSPNSGYFGADTFTYLANDGTLNSNVATVTITVNEFAPPNTAPIATDDNYTTSQNVVLSIDAPGVLSNDSDAENDVLSAVLQNQPSNGTVTLNPDGSFVYSPYGGYYGTDTFTYLANDGTLNSNVATVIITVNEFAPPNTAPIANDDTYTTYQNVDLQIAAPGVLSNDSDPENDVLTSVLQSQPGNGTVTLNPDGSFVYSPNSGYFGADTFTYLANDGNLNSSIANVTVNVIEVTPPNTVPIATDDTYSTNQDVDLVIAAPGVLSNDSDAENDALTSVLQSKPGNGTLTLNPDGSFVYSPNSGYFGTDTFTYLANDGTLNSNVATVTITVIEFAPPNTAPIANDDTYITYQNVDLQIAAPGVLSNDSDPENDVLTSVLQSQPGNGTVTLNPDGSFVYSPNSGYFGTDTFSYLANDGTLNSNIATVTVNVTEVTKPNTAPLATDDAYNTNQDVDLTIDAPGVLSNDSDAENDALTAILQSQPGNGTVTLNRDGSFVYSPNSGYFGTDTFTYLANDGTLNSNVATVTITVNEFAQPNTAPLATDDTYTTYQNVVLSIDAPGILGNDNDPENDVLTSVLQSQPGNGTVTLNADGSFIYSPNSGYFGTDTFTYLANDGTLNSNVATVTITVNEFAPPNTAPIANDDTYTTYQNVDLQIAAPGVLSNDSDAENDALNVRLLTNVLNGTLLFNADGSFSFVPNFDFTGEDSFSYVANDGKVDSNEVIVLIKVNAVTPPSEEIYEHIFIYPNPTPGPFTFDVPSGWSIEKVEVYDARGRYIMTKTYSENKLEYTMNLSSVEQAVYILKLYTSEGIRILRVIIY